MSDDEVARIIAEEAARRRDRAQVVGVSAYLEREPLPHSATRPGDVNKRFLGHTVNAVLGYNRRNQEEQCWQQRSLEPAVQSLGHDAGASGARGAKRSRSPAGAADGDRLQARTFREAAQLEQQASREAWALKKAAQASVVQVPAAPAQAVSSSDKKEAKKKGDKKKHKKEKKKRHKKERKKEKNKRSSSSTENSSSESESGSGSGFIHF